MTTIAVLFHERTRDPATYKVHYLAEFWREAGHRVVYLFGIRRFVPADILLSHVDLSVVPPDYVNFSAKYPVVLNRNLTDIRKSRISKSLLGPDDSWAGPVIVKSDLNFGGDPERELAPAVKRLCWSAAKHARHYSRLWLGHQRPLGYKVFRSLSEVPYVMVSRRDLIIERFLPEMEGGLYRVRVHQVLGDRWTSTRIASRDPVVKGDNAIHAEKIEPHPIVEQWRRDLHLDYGKLDYVIVDGEPILLDVNKTIGTFARDGVPESIRRKRRHLAEGIDAYLAQ